MLYWAASPIYEIWLVISWSCRSSSTKWKKIHNFRVHAFSWLPWWEVRLFSNRMNALSKRRTAVYQVKILWAFFVLDIAGKYMHHLHEFVFIIVLLFLYVKNNFLVNDADLNYMLTPNILFWTCANSLPLCIYYFIFKKTSKRIVS